MKKIPSLFVRELSTGLVRNEITPGCEWVADGEGMPTVKHDGTACLWHDGLLYKRYDRKRGRAAPAGWIACEDRPDEHTGHWPGWVPVGDGPEDRWHREALAIALPALAEEATYELVGPKINGNPYGRHIHGLIRHGAFLLPPPHTPRGFVALREWFSVSVPIEGNVWWHPDGRRAKIKRRDFGLAWP